MKNYRCPCDIITRNPCFVGVQEGIIAKDPKDSIPDMVLWNCRKGSTHAILWPETTEPQRAAARLAELSRAASEMALG